MVLSVVLKVLESSVTLPEVHVGLNFVGRGTKPQRRIVTLF